MDEKLARSILSLHRADDVPGEDARFLEAQQLAESNPVLKQWWAEEKELDELIASKLRSAPVPAGLKESILNSEPRPVVVRSYWRRRILLAAACVVALGIIFGSWRGLFQPSTSLASYREEMVDFVKVAPPLSLETGDLNRVNQFLAQTQAPSGFEVPPKLRELKPVGCRTLRFKDHDVALVCFLRGDGRLAHLFVIDRAAFPALRDGEPPLYSTYRGWTSAAWASGDKAYLVMLEGGDAQLEKMLDRS